MVHHRFAVCRNLKGSGSWNNYKVKKKKKQNTETVNLGKTHSTSFSGVFAPCFKSCVLKQVLCDWVGRPSCTWNERVAHKQVLCDLVGRQSCTWNARVAQR